MSLFVEDRKSPKSVLTLHIDLKNNNNKVILKDITGTLEYMITDIMTRMLTKSFL